MGRTESGQAKDTLKTNRACNQRNFLEEKVKKGKKAEELELTRFVSRAEMKLSTWTGIAFELKDSPKQ